MPDTAALSADACARLADPTPVESQGPAFVVATEEQPLRLRSEPRESVPPHRNIIARLPIGHPVRAIDGVIEIGFMEIETDPARRAPARVCGGPVPASRRRADADPDRR